MAWSVQNIPSLPMAHSGLPDALAAANTAFDGELTTRQTVQAANQIAQVRSMDAPIRALACKIVGNMTHAPSEAPMRIAVWIRENVRYTQETPMVEILQGPYRTLGDTVRVQTPMGPFQFRGTGTGDCDDLSILFACLCRSIGVPAYLAGIAKSSKPDSFFHAMGYCNGQFYELSKDAPYGGLGGKQIAARAPYKDIVALIYDPVKGDYHRFKPATEATMQGSCDDDCHDCAPCRERHHQQAGSMGLSLPFGGALRPPAQSLMPVNALQPSLTVPFNIYIPTRQISGISMNGTMGIGDALVGGVANESPLLIATAPVLDAKALKFAKSPDSVTWRSAVSETLSQPPVPTETTVSSDAPPDTKTTASSGIGFGGIALAAAAIYFLTKG